MKNTMRRLLCTLLVVVMCLTSMSVNIGAITGQNIQIRIDVSSHRRNWGYGAVAGYNVFTSSSAYKYSDNIIVECIYDGGKSVSKEIDVLCNDHGDSSSATEHNLNFDNIVKPEKIILKWCMLDSSSCSNSNIALGGSSVMPVTISIGNLAAYNYTFDSTDRKNVKFVDRIGFSCLFTSGEIDMYSAQYVYELPAIDWGTQFHSGYNFDEDSFGVSNFTPKTIAVEYFNRLYGELKGSIIYALNNKKSAKGVCYGIAGATSAFLHNCPSIRDTIYNGNICNNLRNIILPADAKITTLNMTVKDFIKYYYIYQFSSVESLNMSMSIENLGIEKVVTEVEYALKYYAHPAILIHFRGGPGNHTVLAIGMQGNNILINDSNDSNNIGVIKISGKEWTYTNDDGDTWNNKNSSIRFSQYNSVVYNTLVGTNTYTRNSTYSKYIDEDILLVYDEENVFTYDKTESLIEIGSDFGSLNKSDSQDIGKAYWLMDNNRIKAKNPSSVSSKIELVSNELKIGAILLPQSECEINFEKDYKTIKLSLPSDEDQTFIEFSNVNDSEDVTVATITGTASGDEITATQTETGLLVTGISDGTVTLTKDDEVIATQEIKDAVSDIEITYDKDGEDEDVELDYHSHSYASEITTSATHLAEGVMTYTCGCGDSYTEAIEKLAEHTYEKTEIAPTCTANGIITYTCACNDSYTETIEATGHSYADNGICKNCDNYDKAYDKSNKTDNCSCNCHKGGFMSFIWKLINFFNKLFKTNKTCSCGASHY